ncbi:DNA-binding domain-containing protein [Aliikangiella maris]|uniref:DNA-binding domain-containing protein n=2 Tax=Aliikangiella maris TaxID=3162458 RepID=A0ABV2BX22_9GAMM
MKSHLSKAALAQIQHWMTETLTVRGNLFEKLTAAKQATGLSMNEAIRIRPGVNPYRRLDVYAAGYVMRLLDCLKSEFPLLMQFMGEDIFETFAKAYIVSIPSENWSLYSLGEKFSDFLKDTQPNFSCLDLEQAAFIELPAQIAKYERARAEVALAKGLEGKQIDTQAFSSYQQLLFSEQQPVKIAPCVRKIKLEYPILHLVEQIEQLKDYALPQRKTHYLAITRENYRLVNIALEDWQYYFLQYIEQPTVLNKAIQFTAKKINLASSEVLARLMIWLPTAISQVLIVDAESNK